MAPYPMRSPMSDARSAMGYCVIPWRIDRCGIPSQIEWFRVSITNGDREWRAARCDRQYPMRHGNRQSPISLHSWIVAPLQLLAQHVEVRARRNAQELQSPRRPLDD